MELFKQTLLEKETGLHLSAILFILWDVMIKVKLSVGYGVECHHQEK